MTSLPVVVPALPAGRARFVGSTDRVVIVERAGGARIAIDRATGARSPMPASFTEPPVSGEAALESAGFLVERRRGKRALFRVGARKELVQSLSDGAVVRAIGERDVAVVDVSRRWDATDLELFLVGASGPVIRVALPRWMISAAGGRPWMAESDPVSRTLILSSGARLAWLTHETLGRVRALGEGPVTLAPVIVPGAKAEVTVKVTRVSGPRPRNVPGLPPSSIVIQGNQPRRLVVLVEDTDRVNEGDALTLRAAGGAFVLLRGDVEVGQSDDLRVLLSSKPADAERFPPHSTVLVQVETLQERAAMLVLPGLRDALARLRAMGVAPDLDDAAVDEQLCAMEDAGVPMEDRLALRTGQILEAHLRASPPGDRVLFGERATARAAAANAALARSGEAARYVSFMPPPEVDEPQGGDVYLRLSPSEREEITARELLFLEPEPPLPSDPDVPFDAAALAGELSSLLDVPREELRIEEGRLFLSLLAAGALAAVLDPEGLHHDDAGAQRQVPPGRPPGRRASRKTSQPGARDTEVSPVRRKRRRAPRRRMGGRRS